MISFPFRLKEWVQHIARMYGIVLFCVLMLIMYMQLLELYILQPLAFVCDVHIGMLYVFDVSGGLQSFCWQVEGLIIVPMLPMDLAGCLGYMCVCVCVMFMYELCFLFMFLGLFLHYVVRLCMMQRYVLDAYAQRLMFFKSLL